jgi:neutral ceramidase
MKVGVSQIDITPKPGVELSGFAARTQPSIGVLDPLFAKAVFLANGRERVLWIR